MTTSSAHTTTTATPGWYPDPQGSGRRFWDGARWTADVLPGVGAPPPPPVVTAPRVAPPVMNAPVWPTATTAPGAPAPARRPRLSALQLGGIGCGFGLLSTVLTWGTSSINGVELNSANGLNGKAPWLLGGPSSEDLAANLAYGSSVSGFSDVYILLLLLAGAFVLLWRAQVDRNVAFAKAAAGVSVGAAMLMFLELGTFLGRADEISDYLGYDVSISFGVGPTAFLLGCVLTLAGSIHLIRSGAR